MYEIVRNTYCSSDFLRTIRKRDKKKRDKKFVTKSKKFAAHDSENKLRVGDVVSIRECTPISKNKRFEVIY